MKKMKSVDLEKEVAGSVCQVLFISTHIFVQYANGSSQWKFNDCKMRGQILSWGEREDEEAEGGRRKKKERKAIEDQNL